MRLCLFLVYSPQFQFPLSIGKLRRRRCMRLASARGYWVSAVAAPACERRTIDVVRRGNHAPQSDGLRTIQRASTPPKYCVFPKICPPARVGRRHRNHTRQTQLSRNRDHGLSQERRYPRKGCSDGEPRLAALRPAAGRGEPRSGRADRDLNERIATPRFKKAWVDKRPGEPAEFNIKIDR